MAVGRPCVRGFLRCERTGMDHIRTLTHNAVTKEMICCESVASLLSIRKQTAREAIVYHDFYITYNSTQ